MNLRPTLEMRQKPQLIMTPKLQQAIKVLAMPRLELQQHLKLELEENPILDEELDIEMDTEEELKQEELDPELNTPEDDLDKEDNFCFECFEEFEERFVISQGQAGCRTHSAGNNQDRLCPFNFRHHIHIIKI